jgi:glycosidase
MKALYASLGLILTVLIVAGCDSTPAISTATARAQATNIVNVTLTIAAGGATYTPSPIPTAATRPATQPATKSATQPSTKAATAPATKAATQPATQPATKAATAPATAPATRAATQPPTQPATQPATKAASVGAAPTLTPTLNSILSTVAASRLLTAAAPTATPRVVSTGATSWFDQTTLYSLYVRSFRDSNGDGIGDLRGVIDGLDYLQSLGVQTIWLLPVFESPSVHGYDITNYYKVQPAYGTNQDLLALIQAVHQRKMFILLDYVVNHTSNLHPNFTDALGNPQSPYSEYYSWGNPAQTDYATFAGEKSMPKLNYDSPKVVKFSTDIALYWLDPNQDGDFSDGVDGFRCDVAKEVFRSFWKHLRAEMTKVNPRSLLLGELWSGTPQEMTPYLAEGHLDAAFDFPLYIQMTGSWEVNNDGIFSGKGNPSVAFGLARSPTAYYPDTARIVRFTNNHDTNRIMSDVGDNQSRAKAAAAFLLTAPGPVIMYQGEEIGMKGNKCGAPAYDACRREPLDWYKSLNGAGQTRWFTFFNAPDDGISVEEQAGNPDSILSFYRELAKLRNSSALQSKMWDMPESPNGLYLLRRWSKDELVVVAINFTTTEAGLTVNNALFTADGVLYQTPTQPTLAVDVQPGNATDRIAPGGVLIWRMTR